MTTRRMALIIAFILATHAIASAQELVERGSTTSFEKRPLSEGKRFFCLGAGLRKYAFFKLYAMDFCVEEPELQAELDRYFAGPGKRHAGQEGIALAKELERDPAFFDELISMAAPKRAEMVFLRGSEAAKVRAAFAKNIERALGSGEKEKATISEFVSAIERDVAAGDRVVFQSRPDGELVFTCERRVRRLKHEHVQQAFWGAYFGPSSPIPSLKESVAAGVAELRRGR